MAAPIISLPSLLSLSKLKQQEAGVAPHVAQRFYVMERSKRVETDVYGALSTSRSLHGLHCPFLTNPWVTAAFSPILNMMTLTCEDMK